LSVDTSSIHFKVLGILKEGKEMPILEGSSYISPSIDNPDRLQEEILLSLREIIIHIRKVYKTYLHDKVIGPKVRFDDVFVRLSSPWIISQANILSHAFRKPTKMNMDIIDQILDHEYAKPNIHVTRLAHKTGRLVVVDRKVLNIITNGYDLTSWKGKKMKEIDIHFLTSSAPSGLVFFINEYLHEYINPQKVNWSSEIVEHYISDTHSHIGGENHICIHVHGNITDMMSISRNGNVNFASFPVGINQIIKRVSNAFSISKTLSESMLALYESSSFDHKYTKKDNTKMNNIFSDWKREVLNFVKIAQGDRVKQTMISLCTNDYNKIFEKLIQEDLKMKILVSNKKI
jgi:hypothetical protein